MYWIAFALHSCTATENGSFLAMTQTESRKEKSTQSWRGWIRDYLFFVGRKNNEINRIQLTIGTNIRRMCQNFNSFVQSLALFKITNNIYSPKIKPIASNQIGGLALSKSSNINGIYRA